MLHPSSQSRPSLSERGRRKTQKGGQKVKVDRRAGGPTAAEGKAGDARDHRAGVALSKAGRSPSHPLASDRRGGRMEVRKQSHLNDCWTVSEQASQAGLPLVIEIPTGVAWRDR